MTLILNCGFYFYKRVVSVWWVTDGNHAGPTKLFDGDGRLDGNSSASHGFPIWPNLVHSSLGSGNNAQKIIQRSNNFTVNVRLCHCLFFAISFSFFFFKFSFITYDDVLLDRYQVARPVMINSSPVSDEFPIPRFLLPEQTASRRQDGPFQASGSNNLQVLFERRINAI